MASPLEALMALFQGSIGSSRSRLMTGQPRGDELSMLLSGLSPDDVKMGTMPLGPGNIRASIDQGILSPSGSVSAASRSKALERVSKELFGDGGLAAPTTQQPSNVEVLLRQAKELRDLAARGMKPRAYLKKAEELERMAGK